MLDPVGRHLRPEKPIPVRRTTISPRLELGTQVLTGVALLAALQFHLLASLLAGLLVYQIVHLLAPNDGSRFVHRRTGKIIIVALLAILVIAAIGIAILGLISLLSSGSENLSVLLQKMAEVIETARSRLRLGRSARFLRNPPSSRRWLSLGCASMPGNCAPSARMSGELCSIFCSV